jgi:hypothetical protein
MGGPPRALGKYISYLRDYYKTHFSLPATPNVKTFTLHAILLFTPQCDVITFFRHNEVELILYPAQQTL